MTLEQLIEMGLDEETAKKVLKVYQGSLKDKYIPIERFNEVNEEKKELRTQLDERDTQLKDLKKKAEGNEELTKQIEQLQEDNKAKEKEYKEKIAKINKDNAIERALSKPELGVQDIEVVRMLLKDDAITLNEDGELVGVKEQIETLQKEKAYLFKPKEEPKGEKFSFDGFKPAEGKDEQKPSLSRGEKLANMRSEEKKIDDPWG